MLEIYIAFSTIISQTLTTLHCYYCCHALLLLLGYANRLFQGYKPFKSLLLISCLVPVMPVIFKLLSNIWKL